MARKSLTQKLLELLSFSTHSKTGSSINASPMPRHLEPKRYYTRCDEMPMSSFVEISKTGDLKSLIIEGEPSFGELAAAWAALLNEFYDITDNAKAKYEWLVRAEYNLAVIRFSFAEEIMKIAAVHRSEGIVISLQNLGFEYDFADDESYYYDIQSCKNEMIAMRFKLRVQEQEVKALDKSKDDQTTDDFQFERINVRLSKYMSQNIDYTKISVAQFGFMLNEYVNSIKPE